MNRLGLNQSGYGGERIDAPAVLDACVHAASRHGWTVEHLPAGVAGFIPALTRIPPRPTHRLYVSAGIHGDEPAALAALSLLLEENPWPPNAALYVCPCLNPTGSVSGRRENAEGIDLNRDYRQPRSAEVAAHTAWLRTLPRMDLALCLHEDWESDGFYLYALERHPTSRLPEMMILAAAALCPINRNAVIEGRSAADGIIRPPQGIMERPDWPEAFFLFQEKTDFSLTLETPSDFPLAVRIRAMTASVHAALAWSPSG
jgi:predicted deacylase